MNMKVKTYSYFNRLGYPPTSTHIRFSAANLQQKYRERYHCSDPSSVTVGWSETGFDLAGPLHGFRYRDNAAAVVAGGASSAGLASGDDRRSGGAPPGGNKAGSCGSAPLRCCRSWP